MPCPECKNTEFKASATRTIEGEGTIIEIDAELECVDFREDHSHIESFDPLKCAKCGKEFTEKEVLIGN